MTKPGTASTPGTASPVAIQDASPISASVHRPVSR